MAQPKKAPASWTGSPMEAAKAAGRSEKASVQRPMAL
jgi:hypothetical protein